jgi:hypothetical protein
MVTSKPRMIFSRLSADVQATGLSRYVVDFFACIRRGGGDILIASQLWLHGGAT